MTSPRPTFNWDDGQSWLSAIPNYASSVLTAKLRTQLKRTRPKCWSDNMAWLGDEELADEFQELFLEHYGSIRGFHGCRPVSVASYFERGLLGQSQDSVLAIFRQLFSDVPSDRLNQAIDALADRGSSERGHIYFCATADELINWCGHYLIQGSEYLMALAAALCSRFEADEDYRMRLREVGIPTIFEVEIPLEYLPSAQVGPICNLILSVWGQRVSGNHLGMDVEPCYIIHRNIERQFIRGHYHPSIIRDPHMGHSEYRVKGAICDVCHGLGQ